MSIAGADLTTRLCFLSRAIGVTTISAGVTVLLSWMFSLPGLARLHPAFGGMSSHAALCFVFVGAGLVLSSAEYPRYRSGAWGAGALAAAISLSTLAASYGVGFGIDWIFQGPLGQTFPGRMPFATAIAFASLGFALLLIDVEWAGWRPSEFLAFAAMLISLLALIAYTFSFVSFLPVPNRRSLAFHTLLLLFAVSFGILAARPRRGLMALATSADAGGIMVRRLLPSSVGLPVLAGWLVMEGQRARLYPPVLSFAYYALSIVAIFGARIWFTAAALHRIDVRREEAESRVRLMNADLERRVVERTAQLETANKELEAFSYSVSHDLRAPLRAINGFSGLLQQQCRDALGPTGEQYLRNVSDASQRMGQLIDDLLSLSRVTRNPMKRDALDLSVIASEVVESLRRSSPVHDVHVTIAAGLHTSGDRNLMRIVLENLLANAWKFTRRAQEPRVEVGMCLKEARSVFYVRDNGAGFDMKYANKLFGAFQRLHGQSDFEGTGIGLATVQRIIRRHAGDVWAEGVVGQGATFYFTLGALGLADGSVTES